MALKTTIIMAIQSLKMIFYQEDQTWDPEFNQQVLSNSPCPLFGPSGVPGFRVGKKFWKILPRGEEHFFKGRRGNTLGGNPISEISLDQPGARNANSVSKKVF